MRSNSVFVSFYLHDIQYIMGRLTIPWAYCGCRFCPSLMVLVFCFCSRECFDFWRAVVNPTSLWFWVLGSEEFSYWVQMQIFRILWCSIPFPRG